MIHPKNNDIEITQVQTKSNDILHLIINIAQLRLNLIVVYFSSSDIEKQMLVKTELNELNEKAKSPMMMTGDFNGHVDFLGEQSLDKNGQIIIECLEKVNLY